MRRVAGVDDTIPLDVEGACISIGLAIAIARRHVHLCVFIGLHVSSGLLASRLVNWLVLAY